VKITLTADGGAPVSLGDDGAGDFISGDLPEQSRNLQLSRPSRADYARAIARHHRLTSLPWMVDRVHTSLAQAAKYKFTHAQDVPDSGLLEISDPANFTLWIAEAVIVEVRCLYHYGLTTGFQYRLQGGQVLLQNPNT
jgi:hypothetical protein